MNEQHPSGDLEQQLQDKAIEKTLSRIKHKILVMSGKGGVGKSTVAANLAVGLAQKGKKVGLIDVDLHGPSIPRLLGLDKGFEPQDPPRPIQYSDNLAVVSIEPLLPDRDKSIIWRGPVKIGVIRQFISEMVWDDLDYLIVDSPPGTGDEPLTVAQTITGAQALIVTTPQEVALADVRKSIDFCGQVHMPILGLVENLSGMSCPHCGEAIDFLKTGGGSDLADKAGLPLLGRIPFVQEVVACGDLGSPDCAPFEPMIDAVLEKTREKSAA
jgi:Mrp family chromosome partitioning ATPase